MLLRPWRSATRQLNRLIVKCRLSWQGTTMSRRKRAGSGSSSTARRTVDSAYILAVFFICFLLLMLSCQVLVMRSELSVDGKSHHRSPSASSLGRRALRFGRQAAAPFGRALAASPQNSGQQTILASQGEDKDSISNVFVGTGEWIQQERRSRDEWVAQFWSCFQGQAVCPWQPVAGAEKGFVFSAYLDNGPGNSEPNVRVIGVARTKKPSKLWCQLGWTVSTNSTARWSQVPAHIKVIREHWNLRYSAVFILCPLKSFSADGSLPEFVSISSYHNPEMPQYSFPQPTTSREEFNSSFGHWSELTTGNLLPIVPLFKRAHIQHPLSVCVKPLHYNFNRADQLIEFIELHRLLGATHFTFYNHTIGDRVDCVLRRYAEEGLVEVLPWHQLDVISQKEIRTEGIFASLNDCLYRHMYDSQYLLMIDLDEVIIPRTNNFTLTELLNEAINSTSQGRSKIGAFYFRNAFFYLSWPDDSIKSAWGSTGLELTSLQKTRRVIRLHPHRIRSKYICKPRAVVEVGNHFVWEFRAGHVAAHVPDSMAIMHHYRTCEYGGESCLKLPSMQDRSAWKYGDALVQAIHQRSLQFRLHCPGFNATLPPIFPSI